MKNRKQTTVEKALDINLDLASHIYQHFMENKMIQDIAGCDDTKVTCSTPGPECKSLRSPRLLRSKLQLFCREPNSNYEAIES